MINLDDIERYLDRITQARTLDDLAYILLMLVPIGRVVSYAALAKALGTSPRRVGLSMKRNRVPIVVPCHRVIAKNLRLHGYSLGIEFKAKLLRLEGVPIESNKVSDPSRLWDRELLRLIRGDEESGVSMSGDEALDH